MNRDIDYTKVFIIPGEEETSLVAGRLFTLSDTDDFLRTVDSFLQEGECEWDVFRVHDGIHILVVWRLIRNIVCMDVASMKDLGYCICRLENMHTNLNDVELYKFVIKKMEEDIYSKVRYIFYKRGKNTQQLLLLFDNVYDGRVDYI